MKKFLAITAAAIALAALSFWGYVSYRQRVSYDTLIPDNTAALVRVDVYRIYKSLAGSLFRQRSPRRHMLQGISIPANIFCYTLKDGSSNTLFSTLPVDDSAALSRSLTGMGISSKAAAGGIQFAENAGRTFVLAYNDKRISVAFFPGREDVSETLIRLLKQEHMVPVNKSRFSKIREQEGHISLFAEQGKGRLDFQKGAIVAELDWRIADSLKTWELPVAQADRGNALDLYWLGLATRWLEGKQFTLNHIDIRGDSLLTAHPRGFILHVGKTTAQKDTVVTYDYNDDFEKVATVAVKETQVPGIGLQLLADTSLYGYLRRAGIVSRDSNILQRSVFPLYKLHTGTQPGALWAATTTQAPKPVSLPMATGPFIFYLQADFDRLRQVPDLAWLSRYTNTFASLLAHARQLRDKRVVLSLRLTCKKAEESSLLQLPGLF